MNQINSTSPDLFAHGEGFPEAIETPVEDPWRLYAFTDGGAEVELRVTLTRRWNIDAQKWDTVAGSIRLRNAPTATACSFAITGMKKADVFSVAEPPDRFIFCFTEDVGNQITFREWLEDSLWKLAAKFSKEMERRISDDNAQ